MPLAPDAPIRSTHVDRTGRAETHLFTQFADKRADASASRSITNTQLAGGPRRPPRCQELQDGRTRRAHGRQGSES